MNLRALLFDLDGTILDTVSIILKSCAEVYDRMGMEFDEAFVRSKIGIPLLVQGELFAGERSAEFIRMYREVYARYHGQDSRLFPSAAESLVRLKALGFKLALVTSKSLRSTSRVTSEAGIADLFDAFVTCDDVTRPKPDPEPVLRALDVLGVEPSESIYIGDAAFDLAAASAAGVPMIGVSWGAGTREDLVGCVAVVDDWNELVRWIESKQNCQRHL